MFVKGLVVIYGGGGGGREQYLFLVLVNLQLVFSEDRTWLQIKIPVYRRYFMLEPYTWPNGRIIIKNILLVSLSHHVTPIVAKNFPNYGYAICINIRRSAPQWNLHEIFNKGGLSPLRPPPLLHHWLLLISSAKQSNRQWIWWHPS